MTTLKAGNEVIQAILLAYRAGLAVMLSGRHGIGKSELLQQAAKALRIGFLVRDLSMMEPPDLMGLPQITEGRTVYCPPSALPSSGAGLMVMEELNRCPQYMQSTCYQLLTARKLNDYDLPKGWMPVAAINPPEADHHVSQMDPALLSRFVLLSVVPDPQQWVRWAEAEGNIVPAITAFVRHSPNIFDDPQSNPRAWTYASQIVREWDTGNYTDKTCTAMIEGTVGEKWAAAFWQFYQNDRAPLLPEDLVSHYSGRRAKVRVWLERRELDLISATLELLKEYLVVSGNYTTVIENQTQKENTRTFLSDLPGDIKSQAKQWLKKHKLNDLDIPEKPL